MLSWNPSHFTGRASRRDVKHSKEAKTAFCPRNELRSHDYNVLFTSPESQNNKSRLFWKYADGGLYQCMQTANSFSELWGGKWLGLFLPPRHETKAKTGTQKDRGWSQGMETQTERSKPSSVWPRTAVSTGTPAVERMTGLIYSPTSPTNKPPSVASPRLQLHRAALRLCVSSWPRHGQINYRNGFRKGEKGKKNEYYKLDYSNIGHRCGMW